MYNYTLAQSKFAGKLGFRIPASQCLAGPLSWFQHSNFKFFRDQEPGD